MITLPYAFGPDLVRTIVIGAYALMTAQVSAIVWYYIRVKIESIRSGVKGSGVLPLHVWLITATLWALATECVVFTYLNIGLPITAWTWGNLVLFLGATAGLYLMLRYERRRLPSPKMLLLHLRNDELGIRREKIVRPDVMKHQGDGPRHLKAG